MFIAGLSDDHMLQKLHEKENLLSFTVDEVSTFARTIEGAKESVVAIRISSTRERDMSVITSKSYKNFCMVKIE